MFLSDSVSGAVLGATSRAEPSDYTYARSTSCPWLSASHPPGPPDSVPRAPSGPLPIWFADAGNAWLTKYSRGPRVTTVAATRVRGEERPECRVAGSGRTCQTAGFLRRGFLRKRPLAVALRRVVAIGLLAAPAAAATEPGWAEGLMRIDACGTPGSNEFLSDAARCLLGKGLNRAVDDGARLARQVGKSRFGEHFQLVENLSYSEGSGQAGLFGDVDAVIPFSFAGGRQASEQAVGSAFFLQQGISRWRNGSSSPRNDLRHGLVYRFGLSGTLAGDILGVSLFHLTNVEMGHEVLVPGMDYVGRWGTASMRYISPTTGWRPTQDGPGLVERATEGMELSAGVRLTSTLRLNATGYRREHGDGSGRWTRGVRLDVGWRPHPWLDFSAGYDGTAGTTAAGEALAFQARVRIPLTGQRRAPRWEGLGHSVSGTAPNASNLWRPMEGVNRIRVATRRAADMLAGSAEVRFVGDTVASGAMLELEVLLPTATPEDLRLALHLVPGSGSDPAVPNVDYVDEPVEMTIPAGATTGRVFVQLLRNDSLQMNRSLGVTVSVAST